MNISIASANWQQLKGALLAQWGAITGNHLCRSTGSRMQRAGSLHVAHEVVKERLAREIDRVQRRSRTKPKAPRPGHLPLYLVS